jgi:hypothetical protein
MDFSLSKPSPGFLRLEIFLSLEDFGNLLDSLPRLRCHLPASFCDLENLFMYDVRETGL